MKPATETELMVVLTGLTDSVLKLAIWADKLSLRIEGTPPPPEIQALRKNIPELALDILALGEAMQAEHKEAPAKKAPKKAASKA